MSPREWGMILVLSLLWGGSFLFTGIAVRELPAFTIVVLRVGLAALILNVFVRAMGLRMPWDGRLWAAFFGMGLFDGTFRVDGGQIHGGGGGVWVIADSADSTVVLDHVTFSGLSGPAVEELECCGFNATVTGGP